MRYVIFTNFTHQVQHWLKQFSWLEYKSSSAGVGGAADRRDDDADRRDDDTVVDVEGGESDGTAKNTETELNMRMFCKYCCKYEKAGSFVVSSPVFKLERKQRATQGQVWRIRWTNRENRQLTKCVSFLGTHFAIAKHSRPCTDFVWMCTLDDMKGVQIGNTYRNNKQCATFIHHIAQAQRDEIKEMVTEAKFVSLICDGSTDNSHTEAELAYVRYCHQG